MLSSAEVVVLIGLLTCILGGGTIIVAVNSRRLREEESARNALYAVRKHQRLLRRIELLEAEAPDYETWLDGLRSKVDRQFFHKGRDTHPEP
jgi:hypothetical protein